jgi:hypothetical protein
MEILSLMLGYLRTCLQTRHARVGLKTVIVAETEIELIVKERYSAKLCVLLMLKKSIADIT